MTPTETVREFCVRFGNKDLDGLIELMHEDVVWHNVGTPAFVGREASAHAMQTLIFDVFPEVDFRITSIAADGGDVLTERVDTLTKDGIEAAIPLMGIFVVRDGLIVAWRDYIDQAVVGKYLTGEDVGDLAPVL